MLDTVKLRSGYLQEHEAARIERQLVWRRAVDGPTGELLYELVSGPLTGSYDHRVSLVVHREEWVSERLPESGRVYTRKESSRPYVELEGSIHKAMLGHNVAGGPCDFLAACRWFVADVSDRLGVPLPQADGWTVRRVDWAECYELTYEGCEEYVQGLNAASYPRRKVARYGDESISSPGTSTAVKVYHKGPEFAVHDRRRFRKAGRLDLAYDLQGAANSKLRVEVGIKARKLDEDHRGEAPRVDGLTVGYILAVYDREVRRLLREGVGAMRTVRRAHEVEGRLVEHYGERCAAALYATWVRFSTMGEDHTKRVMKRRTFYLHRKQLQDAGVSWHGTDVALIPRYSHIPAGFSPVRSDPRRVAGEDPEVVRLLVPYREMVAD